MRDKKKKLERGELTIEAVIVVTTAMMIVFLTLDIALAVYRQANVTVVANRAADLIGNVYGCGYKEPELAYQSSDDFTNTNIYRYLFGKKNWNKDIMKKAVWYAGYTLRDTELSSADPDYANEVKASFDVNAIGNLMISITIERKYTDFFLKPMKWLGIEPAYTCTATGTAQCYDIIDYINDKSFRQELYSYVDNSNSITQTVNSFISICKTIKAFFD